MQIDVNLGPEAQRKLEKHLSAGMSTSDIILAGLSQLEEKETYEAYLRSEVALGIEALDAGNISTRSVDQIGDDVFARFRSSEEG